MCICSLLVAISNGKVSSSIGHIMIFRSSNLTDSRFCGIIKPLARSKSQLNISLANAITKMDVLNHAQFILGLESLDHNNQKDTANSTHLLDPFIHELTREQLSQLHTTFGSSNISVIDGFKRYRLNKIIVGSKRSQRSGSINRASHRICYRRQRSNGCSSSQSICIGEVHFFASVHGVGDYAWVTQFKDCALDRRKSIASVGGKGRTFWIPLHWIVSVVGIMKEGGLNVIIGDFPELMGG